jgi:hypothetical protein
VRAALQPAPRSNESGSLPRIVLRRDGFQTDEAKREIAEAALSLHDDETVGFVLIVVREDTSTLDVHGHVPRLLHKIVLDGLAAVYAGLHGSVGR